MYVPGTRDGRGFNVFSYIIQKLPKLAKHTVVFDRNFTRSLLVKLYLFNCTYS